MTEVPIKRCAMSTETILCCCLLGTQYLCVVALITQRKR